VFLVTADDTTDDSSNDDDEEDGYSNPHPVAGAFSRRHWGYVTRRRIILSLAVERLEVDRVVIGGHDGHQRKGKRYKKRATGKGDIVTAKKLPGGRNDGRGQRENQVGIGCVSK
jgi:hypothetical protein